VRNELNIPFQILTFSMAVLMFSMPLFTFAQQNLHTDAMVTAQRDADNDTNSGLWFLAGCLGGVVGLIVAYAVEPAPPAQRLLGASPEYVAFYTDAYSQRARKRQVNGALIGCVANALVTTVYVGVVLAAELD
jgi:drug/metabolite transporter (DMT)-like permease